MKKQAQMTIYILVVVILMVVFVKFVISGEGLLTSARESTYGTETIADTLDFSLELDDNAITTTDWINKIEEQVDWIKKNESDFEKYTSHSVVMFAVWFDDSNIVYFNRGYHGLGIHDLKYYYDNQGRLIFICITGIERDSKGEIVDKQFHLYFNDDSLIQLKDISDDKLEIETSETNEWIINNVDELLDNAYFEWKVLIQEDGN